MRALTPKRWLASAGTAAVLAVAAATLTAGCSAPPSQHAATVGAPVVPGIPRYYVALDSKGPVSEFPEPLAAAATVRVTATGAVIARIVAPRPFLGFAAVTGAANDRSFVLLAHARTDPFSGYVPERLFLLRIDPGAPSATARVSLTKLPISDIPGRHDAILFSPEVGTMALSPDGSSLALDLTVKGLTGVWIYNLATGKTRSWVWIDAGAPGALSNAVSLDPSIPALSWMWDGSAVAYPFQYNYPMVWTQLRLLHLTAPGNNVFADSSPVITIHSPVSFWRQAVMTSDGKAVLLNVTSPGGDPNGAGGMLRISTATGQQATINTLPGVETAGYVDFGPLTADTLLWTNDDGSKIIVADARPGHTLGFYSGGTYTALPWPARAVAAAW